MANLYNISTIPSLPDLGLAVAHGLDADNARHMAVFNHVTQWAKSPALAQIIAILSDDNDLKRDHKDDHKGARLVGGCVRDLCIIHFAPHIILAQYDIYDPDHLPAIDIDLATIHTPDQVMDRLQRAGIKTIPTGIDHGTITAIADDNGQSRPYEITTLRQDLHGDGRHADIKFTHDWRKDAQRRDFTMNALLADISDGNIYLYDPTARGFDDVIATHLTFIGQADHRIAEDYLRILRFFRFAARMAINPSMGPNAGAQSQPDAADMDRGLRILSADGLRAAKAAAAHITTLSRERITQEMSKLITAAGAPAILPIMADHHIMDDIILPQHPSHNMTALGRLRQYHCQYRHHGLSPHGGAGLMAYYYLCFKAIADWRKGPYFRFSNADAQILNHYDDVFKDASWQNPLALTDAKRNAYLYHYGPDIIAQGLFIHGARAGLDADDAGLVSWLNQIDSWQRPVFPISGKDLIAAGISPGPAMGTALKQAETWWITQNFTPNKPQCMDYITTHCLYTGSN